jgi:DNA-binding MarR family transcriptional regulator
MTTLPRGPAPGAEVADRAAEISITLERLATWLRRARPPVEWNAVALSTLGELARRGPLRITDLVSAERLTQPGMTSVVGRLATAGLVIKEADEADGRATLVSVTPAGVAYVNDIHERRAREIARHVRDLSPAHLQSLLDATDAMETLADQPINPGAEHS